MEEDNSARTPRDAPSDEYSMPPAWLAQQYKTFAVGERAFVWLSGHQGEMTEGEVLAVVYLPGFWMPHYVLFFDNEMDGLLEIRSGHLLEMRRHWEKESREPDARGEADT